MYIDVYGNALLKVLEKKHSRRMKGTYKGFQLVSGRTIIPPSVLSETEFHPHPLQPSDHMPLSVPVP